MIGRLYLQEQPITELHDVGLVDSCDLFSVVEEGVAEGILYCPPGLELQRQEPTLQNIGLSRVRDEGMLKLCNIERITDTLCHRDGSHD